MITKMPKPDKEGTAIIRKGGMKCPLAIFLIGLITILLLLTLR